MRSGQVLMYVDFYFDGREEKLAAISNCMTTSVSSCLASQTQPTPARIASVRNTESDPRWGLVGSGLRDYVSSFR